MQHGAEIHNPIAMAVCRMTIDVGVTDFEAQLTLSLPQERATEPVRLWRCIGVRNLR
jgi:hypothetical protein